MRPERLRPIAKMSRDSRFSFESLDILIPIKATPRQDYQAIHVTHPYDVMLRTYPKQRATDSRETYIDKLWKRFKKLGL